MPNDKDKTPNKRLSSLKRKRLQKLCDGYLEADDGKLLPVHRVLMAAVSPLFYSAFITDGSNPGSTTYKIKGIKSDILQQIIDYVINGEIRITDKNINDLTLASNFLQMKDLLNESCDYVRFCISTENCITLYKMSNDLNNLELAAHCYRFIVVHFENLVNSEKRPLAKLQPIELENILLSDDLNVSDEQTIWDAIHMWMNEDQCERSHDASKLLRHLRMNEDEILLNINSTFDDISMNFEITKEQFEFRHLRRPLPAYKCYVTLEYSKNGCYCRVTYDDKLDFWRDMIAIPFTPDEVICDSSGQVYLLQGVRCWSLNIGQNRIQSISNLRLPRRNYGMAIVDNLLYIIGGVASDRIIADLTAVERFNPVTEEWSFVQTTLFPSSGHLVVFRGKIYSFGLKCNLFGKIDAVIVERYDPSFNSWALLSRVPCMQDIFSVWTSNNLIFVASRRRNKLVLHEFNPIKNTWKSSTKTLPQKMVQPKVCLIGDVPILYESSEGVKDPKAFKWDKHLAAWTETSDPFLRKLRHFRIFCIEDSRSLGSLKNRSQYDWVRVSPPVS